MGRAKVLFKDLSMFLRELLCYEKSFSLLIELRLRIDDFFTEISKVHQNTKCFCTLRSLNLHLLKLSYKESNLFF